MKPVHLLPILALLAACSPERRLQRLLRKHPELNRLDAVTVTDTVTIPGDTIRLTAWITDTVTVENERQVVQVVRVPVGSPCDTVPVRIRARGIVRPDTVYRTMTVEVPRVVPCPPNTKVHRWWRTATLVLATLSLALFLLYRYPPHRNTDKP